MNALLEALGPLAPLAPALVLPAAVVFTRMSLFVFLLPGLGTRAIPVRVRLVTALALTGLLTPLVGAPSVGEGMAALVPLLAGEALLGAYLGFAFRVMIFALSIAGTVIAQALSLSQIFGAGISEGSSTTVSTLLTMAGATLFLTADLHVAALGVFADSYAAFPAGDPVPAGGLARRALRMAADGFAFGAALSVPFVLMNLAYNVLLGVLNRAMPQLMVTFVGMPAITFAGLALLTAAVGGLLTLWSAEVAKVFPSLLPGVLP